MNNDLKTTHIPSDFKYMDVFLKGRPAHGNNDLFSVKHPSMDLGRRAKIFSPFDALKGFSEAISETEHNFKHP